MIKEKIDRLVYLHKKFEKKENKFTLDDHLDFFKLTLELQELGVLTVQTTETQGILNYHFDVPDVGSEPTAPGRD